MVQFGEKLVASQYPPWQAFYLDYNVLKKAFTSSSVVVHNGDETDAIVLATEATSEQFRGLLDREIEKVVLFFLEKQGDIASRLASLRKALLEASRTQHQLGGSADYLEAVRQLAEESRNIGEELLIFVRFVELNVTAVRKILKKHDKKFKSHKLSYRYLSRYVDKSDSHLRQLYHYEGISSLVTSIQSSMVELRDLQRPIRTSASTAALTPPRRLRSKSEPYLEGVFQASLAYSTPPWKEQTRHEEDQLALGLEEPILEQISAARRRLHQSAQYVELVAAQALMFSGHMESDVDDEEEKPVKKPKHWKVSSFLNLLSTFLYMTNYYIVAPTSGAYAERLGSSAALSGMIIGMTPFAALVASFLYAWWSTRSYKSALLFASFCSLLGNIFYALALRYESLSMVIVGRYLNGFGSARAINRRYIADTYSRDERTAASAAFVTAGALGMAAGPAIAACIGLTPSEGDLWTVETGPGWVMFVLWTMFFISTTLLFEEPDHTKRFQRQLEMGERKPLLQGTNHEEAGTMEEKKLRKITSSSSPPLYTNIPVMTTLAIYFVLKLVLECLLSSTATLSEFYFDWDMKLSGMYLAILGLLMFPANLFIAGLSHRYDDRELIMGTLVMMLLGLIGFVSYGGEELYTITQYVVFGVCIFLSTNALEGPNMSLLSKTIPRSFARGTFNSGLLATEAGTLGRAVGDVFITGTAFIGFEYLLNYTFIPLGILVFFTIALTWKVYPHLEPADDDDD